MTWSDFLKYSKYIAIFYAIAFVMVLVGIWASTGINYKMLWSGALFFCTAIAANVALGWYHGNHESEMKMAKNVYLARQSEAQVITSDAKQLQVINEQGQLAAQRLDESMRQAVESEIRKQRGY